MLSTRSRSFRHRPARLGGIWLLVLLVSAAGGCGGDDTARPSGAGSDGDGGGTGADLGDGSDGGGERDAGMQPDVGSSEDGGGDLGRVDLGVGSDLGPSEDAGAQLSWPPARCEGLGPLPEGAQLDVASATLVLPCGAGGLSLQAFAEGVLRLRPIPSSGFSRASHAVVQEPGGALPVVAGTSDGAVLLCTEQVVARVSLPDCRLEVAGADEQVLLSDPEGGGYFEDGARVGVRRSAAPGERFYGLGEKIGPLDKRGRRMVFRNTDPYDDAWGGYAPTQDPLYLSIPFFVGLRGDVAYGVLTDNTFETVMDMGAAAADRWEVVSEGGAMDQYLIVGPSVREVVQRYVRLTGPMPLPPLWSLGYHQCRWGYSPSSRVREVAAGLRERALPADAMWLDIQHMRGFRSFTWDPDTFGDARQLLSELRDDGFHAVAIVDPGIKVDDAWGVYSDGLAQEVFLLEPDGEVHVGEVWPGPAVFPDFGRPGTRDWWADLVAAFVSDGLHGIWIDMNEPASFIATAEGESTVPDELVVRGQDEPRTMAELHNVYALEEARATYEGMLRARPDERPFLLTRAGFAGSQRYAALWTGDAPSDWTLLRETLPMLLNLGLSGLTFAGSDVGGYSGAATEEMYARWMQLGSISPFFRQHTMESGQAQEPWEFGLEVLDISRHAIEERYRLMPYLYSLFAEASRTGAPVLRPLVYELPDDPQAAGDEAQAMLGPWLLYSPVLREGVAAMEDGDPNHTVRLPPGRWFERHSGAIYDGPAEVPLRLTLAALPVFVREGAILPTVDVAQHTGAISAERLYLDLYPGPEESSFATYEDDGHTFAFRDGAYLERRWTLQRTATGATLGVETVGGERVVPARQLILRVRRVEAAPSEVRVGDEAIAERASEEALLAQAPGWWYDTNDRSVRVAVQDAAGLSVDLRYSPAVAELRPRVRIDLRVTVPEGTPGDAPIHIAASTDWATHVPLQWEEPGRVAVGSIEVPRGEWYFFKYSRGSWDSVEKYAGCVEARNRYAFGAASRPRADSVATWADWCN